MTTSKKVEISSFLPFSLVYIKNYNQKELSNLKVQVFDEISEIQLYQY